MANTLRGLLPDGTLPTEAIAQADARYARTTHTHTPRDTGWRDISNLLPAGLVKSTNNGRCLVRRIENRVLIDFHLTVTQTGLSTFIVLPQEFRPEVKVLTPFAYWGANTADNALPADVKQGYFGSGGSTIRPGGLLPNPGTAMISLDMMCVQAWPTTLPGTPA